MSLGADPFKIVPRNELHYAQYEEAHTETELNGNKLKVGFKFQNRSDRKVSHASEYPLIYEGEDCCRLLRELLKRNK